ncbi:MAG: GyrI-like domain-containing protein [Rhodobacteraceae bacterium]|nr:GyrI-like domain-containing protein [Paracoccaceae bacterium]
MPNVIIRDEPDRLVAALAHRGAYSAITTSFAEAGRLMAEARAMDAAVAMVAVYHDNPDHVAEADLRAHAGFILKPGRHAPKGMQTIRLEAGRYAICRHEGPYSGLAETYRWLLGDWQAESGEEYNGGTMYQVYENTPETVPAERLVTTIHLPLEDEDFNGPV